MYIIHNEQTKGNEVFVLPPSFLLNENTMKVIHNEFIKAYIKLSWVPIVVLDCRKAPEASRRDLACVSSSVLRCPQMSSFSRRRVAVRAFASSSPRWDCCNLMLIKINLSSIVYDKLSVTYHKHRHTGYCFIRVGEALTSVNRQTGAPDHTLATNAGLLGFSSIVLVPLGYHCLFLGCTVDLLHLMFLKTFSTLCFQISRL